MKVVDLELPDEGLVVVDCDSGEVVATMKNLPESERSLVYLHDKEYIFMPLLPDEIVASPTLIETLARQSAS
ncbi:hypothetical protein [Cronobacter dublinensis]|uniref:hypothetical protein n=1 Tax=Cronobacter dublinensis TaxID=413497 RepID=UPI00300DE82B